jgi:hypothetical protein
LKAGIRGGLVAASLVAVLTLGLAPVSSAQIIGPQDPNDPQVDSPSSSRAVLGRHALALL